ncbi:MAG: PIN domain-containing protein [Actinomycetota bacterium]|nr:PIN domain-containing protein [Actinomycetota bacterium]
MGAWEEVLEASSWALIELDEVADRAIWLMRQYGLSSYDAIHAASAIHADVRDVATIDAEFAAVPDTYFRIHIDAGRVRRCREFRAR